MTCSFNITYPLSIRARARTRTVSEPRNPPQPPPTPTPRPTEIKIPTKTKITTPLIKSPTHASPTNTITKYRRLPRYMYLVHLYLASIFIFISILVHSFSNLIPSVVCKFSSDMYCRVSCPHDKYVSRNRTCRDRTRSK